MLRLKRQLKKLRKQVKPSDEFKTELWHKLEAEMMDAPACVPVRRFRFATAGVVASFVLMFGMGTGVYAYESPSVVEGHPLHFVKDGIETMEGKFYKGSEARARFHMKMMSRRLEEGERHLQNSPKVEQALEKAAERLEMSVDELVAGLQDTSMRYQIIEELSVHQARYQELHGRVLDSEEEIGGIHPLRARALQWGLSEEETDRLFHMRRH